MRLQIIGNYSLQELLGVITSIIEDLGDKRIETVRSVNIYLRPCVNGKEVQFFEAEREIDHMIYDFGKPTKVEVVSKSDR